MARVVDDKGNRGGKLNVGAGEIMVSLSLSLSLSFFIPPAAAGRNGGKVTCGSSPARTPPPSPPVPNSQNNGLSEILELKLHSYRALPLLGRPCIVRPLARGRSLNLSLQPEVRAAPCNAGVRRSRVSLVKSEALREAFSSSGARDGKPRWIYARALAANESQMQKYAGAWLPLLFQKKNPTCSHWINVGVGRNCEDTGRSRSWNSAMPRSAR